MLSSKYKKSASKAVLSRMKLPLHATRPTPHGASRLVKAMSTWSVKTRRAPSRHCRDARVYGHTTTAMHDNEYPPPSLLFLRKPTRKPVPGGVLSYNPCDSVTRYCSVDYQSLYISKLGRAVKTRRLALPPPPPLARLTHQPRSALLDALPADTLGVTPGHDLSDEVRMSAPGKNNHTPDRSRYISRSSSSNPTGRCHFLCRICTVQI